MPGLNIMIKIDVIGESCFLFREDQISIITDPWFGESIYGGAWTQYPAPSISIDQLKSISHIFLSHVHADHCCPSSLEKIFSFSPNAQIVILRRELNECFLTKKLHAYFGPTVESRILRLAAYTKTTICDLSLWVMPSESGNRLNDAIDTSLLIKSSSGLIFFANDNLPCKKHADFINQQKIDQLLAMIPFSGGSGFPCSYENFTAEMKLLIAEEIRSNYAVEAISFLQQTSFRYFMPVAGNHIVVGRSVDWHRTTGFLLNPYSAIKDALAKLDGTEGVYAYPGNSICLSASDLKGSNLTRKAEDFDFGRGLFIETFSSRMTPTYKTEPDASLDGIKDAFETYATRLSLIMEDLQHQHELEDDSTVIICVSKVALVAEARGYNVKVFDRDKDCEGFIEAMKRKPQVLLISIEPGLFSQIVKRQVHINEADAAGLLNYWRTMAYSPALYASIFKIIH